MLYILIFSALIAIFIFVLFFYNFKKGTHNHMSKINFDTIESLNVSKIVKVENDIDFIRNEFWYQYKQKQVINAICFFNLKKIFESNNMLIINDLSFINLNSDIETFELIQLIISDDHEVSKISEAFYLLEKRIK